MNDTAEKKRLDGVREPQHVPWRKWSPYLSESRWGTVRENYNEDGDAWNNFAHDHDRFRASRWCEDGVTGISDEKQRLCFALNLWNDRDSVFEDHLSDLANREGIHGEPRADPGGCHQTGWTCLVARQIQFCGSPDPQRMLKGEMESAFMRGDAPGKGMQE
jgi:hypothetical protein